MNILWHSNSPSTPSGYGNQTKIFTPRLKQAGHQVTISSYFGREGSAAVNDQGILELPRSVDPYGNDIIQAHVQYTRANLVISLVEPFVLKPHIWKNLPWAAWTQVDSLPMLPQNAVSLESARWVIATSRFGEDQIREAGFKTLYVPHGIETSVYTPIDRRLARQEFARFTGYDPADKFLVISVAINKGNPSRKNLSGMI